MNKKKVIIGSLMALLLLSACGKLEKGISNVDPKKTGSDATIPTGKTVDASYQALLVEGKYQASVARRISASSANTNYNLPSFENGLLGLSKETFPIDKFLFQEGQKIKKDIVGDWVGRIKDTNPDGLNPAEGPIVFQQFLEQDFIDIKTQKLAGVSIGIALNQVDYSGETPAAIDDATIETEGKRVAGKVLEKFRTIEGMGAIPVTIGLYKQALRDEIQGGSYILKATSSNGAAIDKWEPVNEQHLVLPVADGEQNNATQDGLSTKFADFKGTVQGFFPNLSGISGIAYYRNNELVKLTVKIETKYFSQTEITSFTQYVSDQVATIFNMNNTIEVQINSLEGPQAFVSKTVGTDKVEAHIFN